MALKTEIKEFVFPGLSNVRALIVIYHNINNSVRVTANAHSETKQLTSEEEKAIPGFSLFIGGKHRIIENEYKAQGKTIIR